MPNGPWRLQNFCDTVVPCGAAVLLLIGCAVAIGQTLEIRGIVQEDGTNAPIGGAEVTVKEFVTVDSVVTPKVIGKDSDKSPRGVCLQARARGELLHRSSQGWLRRRHFARSGGSDSSRRQPASLTKDRLVAIVPPLRLIRPAEMSGKVVDGDGNPRANLVVIVLASHTPFNIRTATDAAGEFRLASVQPGAIPDPHRAKRMGLPGRRAFLGGRIRKSGRRR